MLGDPLKLIPLVTYVGAIALLALGRVTFDQAIVIMGVAGAAHAGISAWNNSNPKS